MIIDKRGDSYLINNYVEVTKENDPQGFEVFDGIAKSLEPLKVDRYLLIWRDKDMEIAKRCLVQFETKNNE